MINKNEDLEFWRPFIDGKIQNGSRKEKLLNIISDISLEGKKQHSAFAESFKEVANLIGDNNPKKIAAVLLGAFTVEEFLNLVKHKKSFLDTVNRILNIDTINPKASCSEVLDGPLTTWIAFENEPGFLKGMIRARKWLDKQKKPITLEILKELHKICLSKVKNTNFDKSSEEKIGTFRAESVFFEVSLGGNASLAGLEEYLNNLLSGERSGILKFKNSKMGSTLELKSTNGKLTWVLKEKGSFDNLSFAKKVSSLPEEGSPAKRNALLIKLFLEDQDWKCTLCTAPTDQELFEDKINKWDTNTLNRYNEKLEIIQKQFSEGGDIEKIGQNFSLTELGELQVLNHTLQKKTVLDKNTEKLDTLVKNTFSKYYEEIEKIESELKDEEKQTALLETTVRLIRFLAELHPFYDGVGRTIVVQLLPKLLRDLGFGECIMENPNCNFVLKSFEESMQELKNGLELGKTKKFKKTTEELLKTLSVEQKKYFYECYEMYYGKKFIIENSVEDYKNLFLLKDLNLNTEKEENNSCSNFTHNNLKN